MRVIYTLLPESPTIEAIILRLLKIIVFCSLNVRKRDSYRHLINPPGRVNYLTLYYPFLIDLPHDSLIFSIYIPHHDDLSGD